MDEALVTSGLQRKAAGIEVEGQPRELLADRMCFDLVFPIFSGMPVSTFLR